jgi:hypothetical protein
MGARAVQDRHNTTAGFIRLALRYKNKVMMYNLGQSRLKSLFHAEAQREQRRMFFCVLLFSA